jgi:hypothetical protein
MDFGLVKRTDLKSTLLQGIIQVNAGHYELDSFQKYLANNLPKMGKTLPKPLAQKDKIFPRKETASDIKKHFHLLEQSLEKDVITEKEYMSNSREILG